MTDLSGTIVPKSDQLNADDLISGPKTIKVTKVTVKETPDQPVSIHFEGDDGKPFKPCKSVRRLLIQLWGSDGGKFVGKRMTLYRDTTVKWAGQEVGGIRVSHVSDIDKPTDVLLTVARGKRRPVTIQPLPTEKKPPITDFEAAKKALAEGSVTLEKLQGARSITDEQLKQLKEVSK